MYYEIEGTTIRLAGSVHRLPSTAPDLPDWVWSAYEWAEAIVFEHDATQAGKHVLLKADDSLQAHLPDSLWHQLVAAWPIDRPLTGISVFKPWMAMIVLSMSQIPTVEGVEPQLTERARLDNKPVTYLETMAGFTALGDTIPETTIHEALALTLAELKSAPGNFLNLHQAWLRRSLEQVETVVVQTILHRMPEIGVRVIDQRNERWVPEILSATAAGQRSLVAVGALHMLGKNGLLALLQRAGYRIRLVA